MIEQSITTTVDISVDAYNKILTPIYIEDENIYTVTINIENGAGTPLDLTSLTAGLLVGKTNTSGTAQAVTVDNAVGGVVSFQVGITDQLYTSVGDYRAVLELAEAPDKKRYYKAFEFTVKSIY